MLQTMNYHYHSRYCLLIAIASLLLLLHLSLLISLISNSSLHPRSSASDSRHYIGVDPMTLSTSSSSSSSSSHSVDDGKTVTAKVSKSKGGPITDVAGMRVRRAQQRGFVVNWSLENDIWSRCLSSHVLSPSSSTTLTSPTQPSSSLSSSSSIDMSMNSLLLSLPPSTPAVFAKDVDEHVLEKWGFTQYRRINTGEMASRGMINQIYGSKLAASSSSAASSYSSSHAQSSSSSSSHMSSSESLHRLCSLVVDSGFSFTHVMPIYQGRIINSAVKRLDVGGKMITNYLAETISNRAWNMLDETYIVNDAKEKVCYVSTDFDRELNAAKTSRTVAASLRREYVLPNGSSILKGFVRSAASPALGPDVQYLTLGPERFAVPEILFAPQDVGIAQGGLGICIADAIGACPRWMQPLMSENIVLVGGNARMKNYARRIEKELRALLPEEYTIAVRTGDDPVLTSWIGGSILANESSLAGSSTLSSSQSSSSRSSATWSPSAYRSLQYVTKAEYDECGSEALTRKWEGDDEKEEEGSSDNRMIID